MRGADAPSGTSTVATLAAAFVAQAERRDPLFADGIGIHTYDDALDDYSAAGHARRIAWLRNWSERLHAAHATAANDAADLRALTDTVDLELFEDVTVRPFRTDPTAYAGVAGDAIYALTGRHYASPEERLRHVAPRLAAIPRLVAAAKSNLTHPTAVATRQAIDENTGNVALFRSLPDEARAASPATRRAIARALPAALASLRDFDRFLRGPLLARSDANPRVGARVFDRELELANGTNESRATLVADARADFDRNRAEMLALALPFDRRFFPGRVADEVHPHAVDIVVRRVLDRLAEDHPARNAVFATARDDVAASEAFLTAHPVVALPQPSTLHVVPTPDFMAGIAGAGLDPAGPFTPMAESYYYIDRISASWAPARVASHLRDFNVYEMRMLSMHEAVPGHYVQFRANAGVPSLVRRAFANGSFAEGWAVYVEGMMLDAGYGGGDPRLRLFQLKWRLREEANTIIDARYHASDLSQAQCFDLLERQAYQEHAEALTKWHRLQLSHDQLTSYFVGLDAIRRAQAAERSKLGEDFDVGRFNAALLAMGSVEPRFIGALLERDANAARSPAP